MGDTQRGDTGGWGQGAEPSRAGILEHLVSFFPAWLRPSMLTEDWQLPRHPFTHLFSLLRDIGEVTEEPTGNFTSILSIPGGD